MKKTKVQPKLFPLSLISKKFNLIAASTMCCSGCSDD